MIATCNLLSEEFFIADKYVLDVIPSAVYCTRDDDETGYTTCLVPQKNGENNKYCEIGNENWKLGDTYYDCILTSKHEGEKGLIWFYEYVRSEWYINKFGDKRKKRAERLAKAEANKLIKEQKLLEKKKKEQLMLEKKRIKEYERIAIVTTDQLELF